MSADVFRASALMSEQELDDAGGDEFRLVDAHDVQSTRCGPASTTATTDPDARLRDLLRVGIATAERLESQAVGLGSSSVSRGRSVSMARAGP
jgi:hypothetical protein